MQVQIVIHGGLIFQQAPLDEWGEKSKWRWGKKEEAPERERERGRERIEKMGVGGDDNSFSPQRRGIFFVEMFSPVWSLLVLLQALMDAAFPWSHSAVGCLTLEDGEVPHRDRPILAFPFIRFSAHPQTHTHTYTEGTAAVEPSSISKPDDTASIQGADWLPSCPLSLDEHSPWFFYFFW